MTYGQKATDAQNTAYRHGWCIDCGYRRQSAGRPRCESCHTNLLQDMVSRG